MGYPNWTKLQAAADQGHEIAAHSLTHDSFIGMSEDRQRKELEECQNDINSNITGQKCITFAYPYCETNDLSLVAQYYIAARICSGINEPKTPRNWMRISSYVCGTEGAIKTSQN